MSCNGPGFREDGGVFSGGSAWRRVEPGREECGFVKRVFVVVGMGMLGAGCAREERVPTFRPMREAVAVAEANRRLVTEGLKATGSVWLEFVDEGGTRRHFDLDGKLQVRPPGHMRFAMQSALGRDEFEVGMNDVKWWVVVYRPRRRYFEGELGEPGPATAGSVPLRAEQLIESLGLGGLADGRSGQRVVDDYQQLLFVEEGSDGRMVIAKECWLDRYAPWLVRRVLFRDDEGRVSLSAELNRYGAVGSEGLRLPYELRFSWPAEDAAMVYRVRRWEVKPSLTAEHRAFVSPKDRGVRFD